MAGTVEKKKKFDIKKQLEERKEAIEILRKRRNK